MTMKEITDFVAQFDTNIPLDKNHVVRNRNRYYLLSKEMKHQVPKNFFYAGAYIGAVKGATFFPSFLLLTIIAETNANRLMVDKKTAWLFICGRDIFKKGIVKGDRLKKGDYTLILNEHNECLGFGKTTCTLREEADKNKVVVKNILDIGDFLRREKRKSKRQKVSRKFQGNKRKIRRATRK
jgi:ribosome biogenesis protein Nip4